MKTHLFVLLMSISAYTFGQSKDETAVASAIEQWKTAVLAADGPSLEKLTSSRLSYGHSGGSIENQAHFVESIVTGKSKFKTMTISDQTIEITNKTAIVRHKLVADIFNNNVDATIKLIILYVWQKEKGTWKMLARQAIKI
jgi:ketosteroid isomerase-like protein